MTAQPPELVLDPPDAGPRAPASPRTRLLLGTVQFGPAYGRRHGQDPLADGVVDAVLSAAWNAGVRGFDTAVAYGVAAERLAAWLTRTGRMPEAHVVTKVGAADAADTAALERAVAHFRQAGRLALLTHSACEADGWSRFAAAVRRLGGDIDVGQSVYTAAETAAAIASGAARVQFPANVFDTRALGVARSRGFAADVRSIYLQGVLIERPADAERRVAGAGRLAAAVAEAARAVGVPAATMLAAAALHEAGPGARIVAGVDDATQIDALVDACHVEPATVRQFIALSRSAVPQPVPASLLDPRQWT